VTTRVWEDRDLQSYQELLRLFRERLRDSLRTQPISLLVLGVLVGLGGGAAAIVFDWLIHVCQSIALGGPETPLALLPSLRWYWLLIIPTAGGILVAPIVYGWASEARGHGVPEVMEAVQVKEGLMRPRVAVAKSIASAITIGSGGSVGREGPVVQIGAALGSLAGRVLRLPADHRRTLVGCGAAAGIAGTFNAPIAGAFFALEVILGNFAISTFSPIVIASVVATAVSRAYFGNFPAFRVPAFDLVAWWELLAYAVLGFVCGIVAVVFSKILYACEDTFETSSIPPLLRPALGGLLVGIMLLLSYHVYGTGFGSIEQVLHGHLVWTVALSLVVLKMLACSITLASGGSGGVFSPSLFIGATVGYTLGHVVNVLGPPPTGRPEAYALVGMGALLSGATHAPVTSVLILFELTNSYGIILPLMLAITISTLTARILSSQSIYTRKLRRKGIPLFRARDDVVMSSFRVRDVMRPELPTVQQGASFASVLDCFLSARIEQLFVLDDEGKLCGKISLHDIKGVLGEQELHKIVTASDLMTEPPLTVQPSVTLADCLQRFSTTEREALPVVTDDPSQRPIGLITRKDLLDLYDREVLRREMIGTQAAGDASRSSSLPAGHRIQTVAVPDSWAGRTLRGLELRQRTGITVIGIQRRHQRGMAEPAAPDAPLGIGDALVVLGTFKSVAALEGMASGTDDS